MTPQFSQLSFVTILKSLMRIQNEINKYPHNSDREPKSQFQEIDLVEHDKTCI